MELNVSGEDNKIFIEKAVPTEIGSGQGINFIVTQHQERSQTLMYAVKTKHKFEKRSAPLKSICSQNVGNGYLINKTSEVILLVGTSPYEEWFITNK